MKLTSLYLLSALLLLLGTIPGHCTMSPIFKTHIKTYSLHHKYGDGMGRNVTHPRPFYLYEYGPGYGVGSAFHNYYLAQANVTEPVGEKLLKGPQETESGKELWDMSFTRTSVKGPNCCWKVTNTDTGDTLLNITQGSAILNTEAATNPIADLASTFAPKGKYYTNEDISIIHGGTNMYNEAFFYMTFEHNNETLYLNGQQSNTQVGNKPPYASLGAIRNSTAHTAPFDETVRWVFTNKHLADYIRGNMTALASDPTPASLKAVNRTDGWLVHSFENYACATRNVRTTHVDIATCVKSCANYTYMTFYRGDTRTHNCECANVCERVSPVHYTVTKPTIYKRVPMIANWTIHDSSTIKSCDAPLNRTNTSSSAHACAQHCAAFPYITFTNYDKSPSGVATSTCACHATCNAVTLASNQQRQPVIYRNMQQLSQLSTPSGNSSGTPKSGENSSGTPKADSSSSSSKLAMIIGIICIAVVGICCCICFLNRFFKTKEGGIVKEGNENGNQAYHRVKTFVV